MKKLKSNGILDKKDTNKGFTLVELLASIVILAIIITIAVTGFTGITKRVKESAYKNKLEYIELAASNYGEDTGNSAVFVDTLIKEGYLEPDDEDDEMHDPRDEDVILNCYVVNINFDKDNAYGQFTNEKLVKDDNKTCDEDRIKIDYLALDLKVYETSDPTGNTWESKVVPNNTWTRSNVVLVVNMDNMLKSKVKKITFNEEERIVNNDFDSKNHVFINPSQIITTKYTVKVEVETTDAEGNIIRKMYTSRATIKIDKQRPIIYNSETSIEGGDSWSNTKKQVRIVASDGQGSGIYGFSISTNSNCATAAYKPSQNNNDTYLLDITENGTYYICAKDNVGNLSEDISTNKIEMTKIDKQPPICNWIGENDKWTTNNVTITLEGVDYGSGSTSRYTKVYSSGEISTDTLTYVISDQAGNETVCTREVDVYLDKVAPTCVWSGENNVWTKNPVTIVLEGKDNGSGFNISTKEEWKYSTGTWWEARLETTISDNVGNSTFCSETKSIKLDTEGPSAPTKGEIGSVTYSSCGNTSSSIGGGSGGLITWNSLSKISYSISERVLPMPLWEIITPPDIGGWGGGSSTNQCKCKQNIKTPAGGSTDLGVGNIDYLYLVTNTNSKPSKDSSDFTSSLEYCRNCGQSYYAWAIAKDALGNRSEVASLGSSYDRENRSSSGACSTTCGTGTKKVTNTCALIGTTTQSCSATSGCSSSGGGSGGSGDGSDDRCCVCPQGSGTNCSETCPEWNNQHGCTGFCNRFPSNYWCVWCATAEGKELSYASCSNAGVSW